LRSSTIKRPLKNLSIKVVCNFEPVLYRVVDISDRCNRNAMRDAILLCEAAGIDQPAGRFHIFQREANVDPRLSRWFYLSEHVIAIERNNGLTRTRLSVLSDIQPKFQKRIINRTQRLLRSG